MGGRQNHWRRERKNGIRRERERDSITIIIKKKIITMIIMRLVHADSDPKESSRRAGRY